MTEKIDIHDTEGRYRRILERVEEEFSKHNADITKNFAQDCKIGLKGQKVGKRRLWRYICDLFLISAYFNGRELDKFEAEDFKRLYIDLDNDKIRRKDGGIYAMRTKEDLVRTIKKFYKWMYDDTDRYKQLVGWMGRSFGKASDPPRSLKREEIEKLAGSCKTKQSALIWFMFDSGARAEELLNTRLKHVIEEKDKDYLKIRIEFSKTLPRTITIPMATPHVKIWLQQHPEKDNPEAQLFPITYAGLYKFMKELGHKVFGEKFNLYPHLMRHSSATYYAQKIKNPYKLNYRYGWATASDMAQQYIDREGLLEEETAEVIKIDEMSQLKKDIELLKEQNEFRKETDRIMNVLMDDSDVQKMLLRKLKEKELVKKVKLLI